MEDLSWDRLDALVDTDPIKLRDIAWHACDEAKASMQTISNLRDELSVIRDMAYRGVGSPLDALQAIQERAARAAVMD